MDSPARPSAPWKSLAVVFGSATVYALGLFVANIPQHKIRTGLPLSAVVTGACAVGLWRRASWGRSLAIVVTLANAGVGTLILMSAILGGLALAGPVAFLIVNVAAAYALTRSWFALPEERKP